ncbi:peptidoglycan-binding domain-containing protein [Actinoplanes sp. NPDC023936]|uniref:peptidoglycan-binding domain-containing protein n=1 Tax=Actinoplanes sp. NPDC023936 TaxID=3154910 RepID=UPI0033CD6FAD
MRLRSLVVAAAVLAAGAAGATAVVLGEDPPAAPASDGAAASTMVRRQTLAQSVTIDGELGYGDPVPMRSSAPGIVTWLPKEGSVVGRGRTVLRADNRRVVLLDGVLPIYRTLRPGMKGPDVRQAERNLRALGWDGFTVDDEYTTATAAAVRRWQKELGLPRTGRIDSSWVIVANGAVRIAEHKVRVGDAATGVVLTYTGAHSVVTVDAEVGAADWARPRAEVSVELPGGKKVEGVVTHVGGKVSAEEDEEPTVPVTIKLRDARAAGGLREAPVEVTYVGERRENVLTVPVAALLALAEGGYGVQVLEGGTSRYVRVTVGMFAGGHAEVRGEGLADGTVVGMPA